MKLELDINDVKILNRKFDSVKRGNPPMNVFYKHLENVKSDYIVNYNPCQPFLDIEKVQRVIDGPHLFVATHSLVCYKKQYMLDNWQYFSNQYNDPFPLEVDWSDEELVDVDTELDFKLVRAVYGR